MPYRQTIAVVNKSGKVGKHLKTLFFDARDAYKSKKSEIAAGRSKTDKDPRPRERAASTETDDDYSDDDHRYCRPRNRDSSRSSSPRHSYSPASSSRRSRRDPRRSYEHGRRLHDDDRRSYDHGRRRSHTHLDPHDAHRPRRRPVPDSRSPNDRHRRPSTSDSDDPDSSQEPTDSEDVLSPTSPPVGDPMDAASRCHALVRRNTDLVSYEHLPPPPPGPPPGVARSASANDVNLEEITDNPPPLPKRITTNKDSEMGEFREEVSRLQKLLDEANCIQHSVTTTIESLQKNPQQLAAVALTLAKVGAIARKMPPGAILALRGAFPAVVALLLSPQFMIAAGVSVGVTIVALGGYKVVSRIRRKKREDKAIRDAADGDTTQTGTATTPTTETEELLEIDKELAHVAEWRQGVGIDFDDTASQTTVEGEFVTPAAGRHLVAEGVLRQEDLRPTNGQDVRKGKNGNKDKSKNKDSTKMGDGRPTSPRAQSVANQAVARLKTIMAGEDGGFKGLFKNNNIGSQPGSGPASPVLVGKPGAKQREHDDRVGRGSSKH